MSIMGPRARGMPSAVLIAAKEMKNSVNKEEM